MAEIGVSEVRLTLQTGKRWWFSIAWVATVALLRFNILKDTDRAARWLARNAMWMRVS